MKNSTEPKHSYWNGWRYAFILLLVAGMLVRCEQATDPGMEPEPDSDPDPDPPAAPARIDNFSASDELISAGETVTLSWEVAGDEPLTLTLEPGGTDVSGETSAEVTPDENTTYRLTAENEAGSDESELTVEVIPAGETAIEFTIAGLPGGAEANVAVTDHNAFMQWIPAASALTGLTPADYTVAAAGVRVSGVTYLPDEDVQSVTVTAGEFINVQVHYSQASGGIYATNPDVGACAGGELTSEAKERGRMSLNFIRALVGLPPVGYDTGDDAIVQNASLMFAANSAINHFPPQSWHCYSDEGAEGAERSNIGFTAGNSSIGAVPEDFITLWADDVDVPSLGHRRWLVDPFLPDIAIGLVEGTPQSGQFSNAAGSALRIVPDQDASISGLPLPFVAYPRGDFPTALFTNDWFLSFSVLADPGGRFNNRMQVDYGSASIRVEDENGSALTVSEMEFDFVISGLPNQLKWKVAGLQDNRRYTVTISGVAVNGESKNFSYEVNLQ